jgi:TonB family protein
VITISVFDSSGTLLRSGTGFFVARDGRLITDWHVVEGGAHAVAKTVDGKIRNIPGIIASSPALDLAVLRAETTIGVPFLPLSKASPPPTNVPVAVVGSSLTSHAEPLAATTIVGQKSEADNDWLETANPIPGTAAGAPVIDENGEVLGVVTSGQEPNQTSNAVVRPVSTLLSLLTKAKPISQASWAGTGATGSPSASPGETPSPTPEQTPRRKVVYAPPPVYPYQGIFTRKPTGSGRYRVYFDTRGRARRVQVVKSSGDALLDRAAVQALQKWRAEPGGEWSLAVPMTFRP